MAFIPTSHQLRSTRRKPIYKRWWFWLAIAIVAIIIAGAISGGGDGSTNTGQTGSTQATQPSAGTDPTTPADDYLTDNDWTASDIQAKTTQFGTSFTATITNKAKQTRTGLFTLTVYGPDGTRITNVSGSASDVEAGQSATVTFIASTDQLPGDPATWTYRLQTDL